MIMSQCEQQEGERARIKASLTVISFSLISKLWNNIRYIEIYVFINAILREITSQTSQQTIDPFYLV